MKITDTKRENCQIIFDIEVEEAEFSVALDQAYKQFADQVEIPGFRKGKAPKSVLEQHLDKDRVWRQAIENVAPDICQKALTEEQVIEHGQPYVEVMQPEGPLTLKVTVPLPPKIRLADYKALKTKQEKKKISAKDVNERIDNLRAVVPDLIAVDRPVEEGDIAIVDLEGRVESKPFINEKGSQYEVKIQEDSNLKGVAENLLGMVAGEEKQFDINLPEDFSTPNLAGKEVNFKAKLLEVKERQLPPLTDELAKKLAPDVEDVAGLKKKIRTHLGKKAKEESAAQYEINLLDELVEKSEIEFPPQLLDSEIEGMIERQVRYWQMLSGSKEEFEQILLQNSYEQLREQFKPPAEMNLKRSLILSTFVDEEKISVTREEIESEIESRKSEVRGGNKEERIAMLDSPETQRAITNELITRKALEKLVKLNEKKAVKADKKTSTDNKIKKEDKK